MLDVNFDLDIDQGSVSEFLTAPVNEQKINQAISSALKKTTRSVKAQMASGLSKDLDVALAGMRKRIFFSVKRTKEGKASIWVGLNDFFAHDIGKIRKGSAGVKVRGHSFTGAFIASPYQGKKEMAWRRASSKHANTADEVRNKASEKNQQNPKAHKLWPRYPLKNVGLKVYQDGLDKIKRLEAYIGQRFNIFLQQELNHQFNVKS